MSFLSKESLEFARANITSYWDSDFYPKRREFEALWFDWPDVVEYLTTLNIEDIPVYQPRIIAAPRPDGAYRVVHQLDPLNTLVCSALAVSVAYDVEYHRAQTDQHIACSYRIQLDNETGNFFAKGVGFPDFAERSRNLAAEYDWILHTDITDFYCQIYLHRLHNSLASIGALAASAATPVEEFLLRLNDKVSQGIPVGPVASVLFAEALLSDIDGFLTNKGAIHTRYVDDIRIFGRSEADLRTLLSELTLYLYSAHRLSLSSSKTRIVRTTDFIDAVLDDPDEVQRRLIHEELSDIISHYEDFPTDEVGDFLSVLAADRESNEERTERLLRLMTKICELTTLDLGLARHVLRTCRRYRLRAIVPLLFDNFDFFMPVLSDVVLYLEAVKSDRFIEAGLPPFSRTVRVW